MTSSCNNLFTPPCKIYVFTVTTLYMHALYRILMYSKTRVCGECLLMPFEKQRTNALWTHYMCWELTYCFKPVISRLSSILESDENIQNCGSQCRTWKTESSGSQRLKHFVCITISLYYMFMMTSSNGNIFRVTGHLRGEFTGDRWSPHTKACDAELWWFFLSE